MPINAGELINRLTIYQAVQTQNDAGEVTLAPSKVASVWGDVRPLSSRESLQYGQQVGVTVYKVIIRFFPTLTFDMWIDYRGRRLEISTIDEHEYQLYMILTCVQRHIPNTNGG
jgi:SPP1 family predicted phage head-tail adaptor